VHQVRDHPKCLLDLSRDRLRIQMAILLCQSVFFTFCQYSGK
jgi:hypothetical protein